MQTSSVHAVTGGSVFLSYAILREVFRHHKEHIRRPKIIDHLLATTLIGGIGSMIVFNGAVTTVVLNGSVVGFTAGLMMWWSSLLMSYTKHSNIAYESGVTDEEIARFEA